MTKGGASAKRMKIAAKETDSTPRKRVTYGFTLISVLSYLVSRSVSAFLLPPPEPIGARIQ